MNVQTKPASPDDNASDRKARDAYFDLDNAIHEVKHMTGIVGQMAGNLIDGVPGDDGLVTLRIDPLSHERLMFAIYHAQNMAADLVQLYNEKWPMRAA
jgi:hypothetical protein